MFATLLELGTFPLHFNIVLEIMQHVNIPIVKESQLALECLHAKHRHGITYELSSINLLLSLTAWF